jgi:sulfoxide reductase heme-binding subunit YedZ
VIALTSPYLWYATRATGMVTLVLFTLVVVLGTLVATRIGGTYVGRFEVNELHRSLSMIAFVFLGLHVATTVVDSYVPTGPLSVVVPFTSAYRTTPVGLGAVAVDLFLAVWISSLLKVRVKNATWRFIHWFSWLAFAIALVHAFTTGTDGRSGWGLVVIVACAALGLASAVGRFLGRPTRAAGRTALSPLATWESPTPAAPAARPPVGGATPRRAVAVPRSAPPSRPEAAPGPPGAFPRAPRPDRRRGRR